jgi:Holliday junction resolvase RusA-like endonuclease
MKVVILGVPQPKQSARFRNVKSKVASRKDFIMSYQKKSVIDNAINISNVCKSQLPIGFIPLDGVLSATVLFVFPALSSWSKKTKIMFNDGYVFYKNTKPDVDNLLKSLFDGLNGVLFTDDSRICDVNAKKIYGKEPRIEIEIKEILLA